MSLIGAAREGDFESIVEILARNPECIDGTDIFGETALHESIYNGYDEIAMYLLEHGASPYLCRKDGATPLHIAANKGRYHVAKALLKNETVRNAINKKDSLCNTPLHGACKKTQVDLVQLLVDNGANTNYVNRRGQRPIDYTRDVRVQRILRGKKWYDDLNTDAIVNRLKKGEERVISSPHSPNKNKKKRRRRGGRNRNKHRMNDEEEHKKQIIISEKKNRKNKVMKDDGVKNKELNIDLKTWLEFNDSVSVETKERYQMVYMDKKLKMKWINYVRLLRGKNLNIIEYNRKMCNFADGLYLEYTQPQYDCNHYIPQQINEYDDSDHDF